jgi:hypothetical protein
MDYRLYCLNRVGHIGSGEWVEAAGDAEAIMIVRAKELEAPCELWLGNRLIARIPAQQHQAVSSGLTSA